MRPRLPLLAGFAACTTMAAGIAVIAAFWTGRIAASSGTAARTTLATATAAPVHPALAAWADAWTQGDHAALVLLYAPDAQVWTTRARAQATDEPTLDYALARDLPAGGPRALTFARHSWREQGTIAVTSGLALLHAPGADDSQAPVAMRFSLVFSRDAGNWTIVDQHLSLLDLDDE